MLSGLAHGTKRSRIGGRSTSPSQHDHPPWPELPEECAGRAPTKIVIRGGPVNRVNRRREFFRATPQQVRDTLVDLSAHVVEFAETPTNEEWDASPDESAQ